VQGASDDRKARVYDDHVCSLARDARVKTMQVDRVGGLLIVAHGRANPSDEEWNEHMAVTETARYKFRAVLVTSLGGGPNAGQRKTLLDLAGGQTYLTCICTDSIVARGVITAFNWLSPAPMHALPYDQIERALEVLEVPVGERAEVKQAVARLHAALAASS
jgi:hypothetical protein